MNKDQIWNKKVQILNKVVDNLGKRIDTKILKTVVGINVNGLLTQQSCQGHLRYGVASPWVDIVVANSEKVLVLYKQIEQLRGTILDEEDNEKPVLGRKKEIWEKIHLITRKKDKLLSKNNQKIIGLLSKFYSSRQGVPYDNRIIIKENYLGVRLVCQGFLLQGSRDLLEKKAKLAEYQNEFSLFADFLKNIFLHSLDN